MSEMKCTKCGCTLEATAKFCSNCGTGVETININEVKDDIWNDEPVKAINLEPAVTKKREFTKRRRTLTVIGCINTTFFLLLWFLDACQIPYTLLEIFVIPSFLMLIINLILTNRYLKQFGKVCSSMYHALKNFIPLLGFAGILVLIAGYFMLLVLFYIMFLALIVIAPYISLGEMWKIKFKN